MNQLNYKIINLILATPHFTVDKKLTPQQLLYYNQSCPRFGTHFDDKPKILTYRQISPDIWNFSEQSVL